MLMLAFLCLMWLKLLRYGGMRPKDEQTSSDVVKKEARVLLLTVPFTASTTNAMEMNRAMTSSVDLEKTDRRQT